MCSARLGKCILHQLAASQARAHAAGLTSLHAAQELNAAVLRVSAMLHAGSIGPLPRLTYPLAKVTDALREFAHARHIGKIVVAAPAELPQSAAKKDSGHSAWVVTGGLGALGLLTGQWLVEQGALRVVLLGRSGRRVHRSAIVVQEQVDEGTQWHLCCLYWLYQGKVTLMDLPEAASCAVNASGCCKSGPALTLCPHADGRGRLVRCCKPQRTAPAARASPASAATRPAPRKLPRCWRRTGAPGAPGASLACCCQAACCQTLCSARRRQVGAHAPAACSLQLPCLCSMPAGPVSVQAQRHLCT